ncbi:hypothetical protein [Rhodopseudomonas boonkerdii]|nr:hypothetical protein [Rhodopseudomonas boonkerdii]
MLDPIALKIQDAYPIFPIKLRQGARLVSQPLKQMGDAALAALV